MLLPTDPDGLEALDSIGQQVCKNDQNYTQLLCSSAVL